MNLRDLPPGTRFEIIDSAGPLRGTLIEATDASALVEFDAGHNPFNAHPARLVDFETADHEWIRLERRGRRRTTITPYCRVRIIP